MMERQFFHSICSRSVVRTLSHIGSPTAYKYAKELAQSRNTQTLWKNHIHILLVVRRVIRVLYLSGKTNSKKGDLIEI